MIKILVLALFAVPMMLLTFQNCGSKNSFVVDNATAFNLQCDENPLISDKCYNLSKEEVDIQQTLTDTVPTDILFALDESCSMEVIANNVRDGFNSLLAGKYPNNTRMAVTYMSPAMVNDDNTLDFLNAYSGLYTDTQQTIISSPGHLTLVNKQTISDFLTMRSTQPATDRAFTYSIPQSQFDALYPGVSYAAGNPNGLKLMPVTATRLEAEVRAKYDPTKSMTDVASNSKPNADALAKKVQLNSFPRQGCNKSWFAPTDVGADGMPCLTAALQLAPVCTGVEAGITSLQHMLKKATTEGRKIFRDGAIINVIFVSDTHDSGQYDDIDPTKEGYYGTPGAPKSRPGIADIQSAILENNPTVSSIKFNGVVPLPEVGSPLLDGLKILGTVPATAAEAVIGSEGTHGYSYLPFIKSTNGLAVHPSNTNWSSIADQIVADARYSGNIFVKLKYEAVQILSVIVNGANVDLSKVILNSDKKSFTLQQTGVPANLNIRVTYQVVK